MNNASPELCLELYRLSGWEGARGSGLSVDYSINGPGSVGPVYDFDYLVRKLPADIKRADSYYTFHLGKESEQDFYANYWFNDDALVSLDDLEPSSSPADAAAKLCIELFNQGILTKEDK